LIANGDKIEIIFHFVLARQLIVTTLQVSAVTTLFLFDNITGFCVISDCGFMNLRFTYWRGRMDGGRIDVSTDHGESYTCAHKDSAVALTVFIVRLLCITSTPRGSPMFRG